MNGMQLPQFRSQIPNTLTNYTYLLIHRQSCMQKVITHYLPNNLKLQLLAPEKQLIIHKKAMSLIVPPLVENELLLYRDLQKVLIRWRMKRQSNTVERQLRYLDMDFSSVPERESSACGEIAQNHLLITEYPPYVKPERWTFPMRNRIISGLSDAVVVTESADKSGTMSTVEHALDHGKDIYAVPGPVTSHLSAGPNKL